MFSFKTTTGGALSSGSKYPQHVCMLPLISAATLNSIVSPATEQSIEEGETIAFSGINDPSNNMSAVNVISSLHGENEIETISLHTRVCCAIALF